MEKNIKNNVYMYIIESLCHTAETGITLYQLYFNKNTLKKNITSHMGQSQRIRCPLWERVLFAFSVADFSFINLMKIIHIGECLRGRLYSSSSSPSPKCSPNTADVTQLLCDTTYLGLWSILGTRKICFQELENIVYDWDSSTMFPRTES